MNDTDELPPLRDVIRRHGISAKKSLGQHFILDPNLTARIARAAGPLDGASVLEVGPGPGGLTRALLTQGARRVVAIERDPRSVEALAESRRNIFPGGSWSCTAMRWSWIRGPISGPARCASWPIFPITSRPRSWCTGSASSPGRRGTIPPC